MIGVTVEVFKLKMILRLEKDFLIIFIYSALPGDIVIPALVGGHLGWRAQGGGGAVAAGALCK